GPRPEPVLRRSAAELGLQYRGAQTPIFPSLTTVVSYSFLPAPGDVPSLPARAQREPHGRRPGRHPTDLPPPPRRRAGRRPESVAVPLAAVLRDLAGRAQPPATGKDLLATLYGRREPAAAPVRPPVPPADETLPNRRSAGHAAPPADPPAVAPPPRIPKVT